MRPVFNVIAAFLLILGLGAFGLSSAHAVKMTKEVYIQRMGDQLHDVSNRIRRLADRGTSLPPNEKARFQLALRKLWQKERVVRVGLERIKRSKGDEWMKLKKAEDAEIISLNKHYGNVVGYYFRGTT